MRHTTMSKRFLSSRGAATKNFSTLGSMPHSTNANSNTGGKDKQNNTKKVNFESLPASEKAKILFKRYGKVFVGTYVGIYFTTLLSFFVTLDVGLLDPDTLSQIFKVSKDMACETADIVGPTGSGASMNEAADAYREGVAEEFNEDKRTLVGIITGYMANWEWTRAYTEKLSENPHLANLAVAWFMVKFTEPVRLAAAVVVTPKVAKALGRKEANVEEENSDDTKK